VQVAARVRALGGVARTRELRARGFRQSDIAAAVARGEIIRLRIGWFGLPGLDPLVIAAHRAGGPPVCATVAAIRGLWMLNEPSLHIAVQGRESRAASRVERRGETVLHWMPGDLTIPVQSLVPALRMVASCLSPLEAVCVLDSALHRRMVTLAQLSRGASGTVRNVLALCDGRAESGVESIFRFRASRAGYAFRTQVEISGGRVDFMFGDRLIVEVDGEEFHSGHEAFVADRERDAWHSAIGYYVVRLTYAQVVHRWHEVGALLKLLHTRGEHLGPTRIRRFIRRAEL
jgi:very-short-patch-repair endonuclease